MTDPPDREGPPEVGTDLHRRSVISARQHVGAAGFAQSEALERIVRTGREQLALSHSIRQVVLITQTQLRDLTAELNTEVEQAQVATLEDVIRSGLTQIEAAHVLQRIINDTLRHVRGTPLQDISAGLLSTLGGVVDHQARSLEELIATAISEAASAKQITTLERVSAEVAERLEAAEHDRTERELAYLAGVHTLTVLRIRELEDAGQSHAAQRVQMEGKAESSQRSITALEAAGVRDLARIAGLEAQQQILDERSATLQATAVTNQDRIKELGGVRDDQTRLQQGSDE